MQNRLIIVAAIILTMFILACGSVNTIQPTPDPNVVREYHSRMCYSGKIWYGCGYYTEVTVTPER